MASSPMPVMTDTSSNDPSKGAAGLDTITGGKGADLLTGRAGADLSAFRADHGADIINDFEFGVDRLSMASGTHNPWVYQNHC
jgi:Ca2+-binding RTX toxin-like protein